MHFNMKSNWSGKMILDKVLTFCGNILGAKNILRSENLYSSPDSKCKRNPSGGREDPSLNCPSNQNQRNKYWNPRLLLQEMVEEVHSSLFNVNGKCPFLQAHCFALCQYQKHKKGNFLVFKFVWSCTSVLSISTSVNVSYPWLLQDQGQTQTSWDGIET